MFKVIDMTTIKENGDLRKDNFWDSRLNIITFDYFSKKTYPKS